jgi:phosphoribosylformylglycinamidine synthase
MFPQVQGDNTSELDFGAVQRGDPEMEQKMNRVIRACVEAPGGNPICSLHDQGAGGNGEGSACDKGLGLLWLLPDLV